MFKRELRSLGLAYVSSPRFLPYKIREFALFSPFHRFDLLGGGHAS